METALNVIETTEDIAGQMAELGPEARAAARCCGVLAPQVHFLDMPFYETGRVR